MTLSDLEMCDASGPFFQANLCKYARTVGPKMNKLGTVTHMVDWRGVFPGGQSHRKRADPNVPQFWGSLLRIRTPFDEERPKMSKFDMVTHAMG